jgi:hypothetical protein
MALLFEAAESFVGQVWAFELGLAWACLPVGEKIWGVVRQVLLPSTEE